MQENKFDKHIAEKLKNRELKPSNSAWERMSNQLDESEAKNKKGYFAYIGYAAGIALLISAFVFFTKNDKEQTITPVIVNIPVDTLQFQPIKNIEQIPVKEVIVQVEKNIVKPLKTTPKNKKELFTKEKIIKPINADLQKAVVANIYEDTLQKTVFPESYYAKAKKSSNTKITINADDLLYAVTHSQEEVKAYYAKYNINRNSILDTIQKQLHKSNLKISPETILAEVEHQINEADFKQNFMQKFKSKLSDVIVAIADRNK